MKVDYEVEHPYFVTLYGFIPAPVILKIEGGSLSGSVKLKTAVGLVEAAERDGLLQAGSTIVESSSGSLGVALAMLCAQRGYRFLCVVDPNASPTNIRIMKSLGSEIACVTEKDENGGYLVSRINYIRHLISDNPDYTWLNQYKNEAGPGIHERTTGPAILEALPGIDRLYIGAGTTGTLMGCARFFRKARPQTRIIAVDSVGSVTFGGAAGERHIPGIGTSRVPEICDPSLVDEVVMVPEIDAIAACRHVARHYGMLLGGSSGSLMAAIRMTASELAPDTVIGALSPDFGERYLTTVYDDEWVSSRFGGAARHYDLPAPRSDAALCRNGGACRSRQAADHKGCSACSREFSEVNK